MFFRGMTMLAVTISSCSGGGAFVISVPKRSLSTKVARNTQRLFGSLSRHDGEMISLPSSSSIQTKPLQPLVVCGPSGVGKGTIIARYMESQDTKQLPAGVPKFKFSVSHTTRQPRPGEKDGVHYHFVTHKSMQDKIEAGYFVEYAEVHGNLYGTSIQSIVDSSSSSSSNSSSNLLIDQQCLLDIDVSGVKSIKKYQSNQNGAFGSSSSSSSSSDDIGNATTIPIQLDAKFLFIAPPSVDVLRERLVGRGTETPETLDIRFQAAKAELEYGLFKGNFDKIVVNDDLDKACFDFEQAVEDCYGN